MKRSRVQDIAARDVALKYESPSKKNKHNALPDESDTPSFHRVAYYRANTVNACRIVHAKDQVLVACDDDAKKAKDNKPPIGSHRRPKSNSTLLLMANVVTVLLAQSKQKNVESFSLETLIESQKENLKLTREDKEMEPKYSEENLLQFVYKGLNLLLGREVMCYWKLEQALCLFEWYASDYSRKYFLEFTESVKSVFEIYLYHSDEELEQLYDEMMSGDSRNKEESEKEPTTPRSFGLSLRNLFKSSPVVFKYRYVLNLFEDGRNGCFWMLMSSSDSKQSTSLYELCTGLTPNSVGYDVQLRQTEDVNRKMLNKEVLPWRKITSCVSGQLRYETVGNTSHIRYYDWLMQDSKVMNRSGCHSSISPQKSVAIIEPILEDLCNRSSSPEDPATRHEYIKAMKTRIQSFEQLLTAKKIALTDQQQERLNAVIGTLEPQKLPPLRHQLSSGEQ